MKSDLAIQDALRISNASGTSIVSCAMQCGQWRMVCSTEFPPLRRRSTCQLRCSLWLAYFLQERGDSIVWSSSESLNEAVVDRDVSKHTRDVMQMIM
mmetsp:Transcript_13062/g.24687  ORF Transcript_13062/g.24687 Transcript_13062/m.24687 type:complete len:97 (+) Transcript_13062:288-578(+)